MELKQRGREVLQHSRVLPLALGSRLCQLLQDLSHAVRRDVLRQDVHAFLHALDGVVVGARTVLHKRKSEVQQVAETLGHTVGCCVLCVCM